MNKLLTTTISLLLLGTFFATAIEPSSVYGYGYTTKSNRTYYSNNNQVSYGYGYGTSTSSTTSSTTTESETADVIGNVLTDAEHEVVDEVPSYSENTPDQSTDSTTESAASCSVDKPSHLKVRYKKTRAILRWRRADESCPSSIVSGYIVRVKTKHGKLIMRTGELKQLRFHLKRKKLKKNVVYTFSVRAVLETGEKSMWSKAKRFRVSKF